MKLSKAQIEVMNTAKAEIDYARSHSLREWAEKEEALDEGCYDRIIENASDYGSTKEEMKKRLDERIENRANGYKEYYENEKNGIVLTHCNSRTLEKLESLGLIEIIYDSNGSDYGIDEIKVLNY